MRSRALSTDRSSGSTIPMPARVRRQHLAAAVVLITGLAAAGAASAQGEGLVQRETEGPAALRSLTEAAIARESAAAAPLRLGDFFLFDHGRTPGESPTGLRLSSGLFGPQKPFTLFDAQVADPPSQPYLGLGYSRGNGPRSPWSLSADVGFTSPSGNNGQRLRGVLTGTQGLEDAMRDLRWSPVMAVNVRYAF